MQTEKIKTPRNDDMSRAAKQPSDIIPRQDAEKIMSLAKERERAFSSQRPMLAGRCRL